MESPDVNRTHVLIAPDVDVTGNGLGNFLSLRHPKSGNTMRYLSINEVLHELNWFKQSYGSWFLGNYVCEDGSLYTATPVDPVFILLPIFEEARMKKGDDQGKFRQLDEIVFVNGYPGYQHMFSIAEKCMQVVCEIKEIGMSKFYRLDDSKVIQIKRTLATLDKNCAAQDERDTRKLSMRNNFLLADAVTILGEYMKDEPWLKLLCSHMKLKIPEVTGKAPDFESALTAMVDSGGSSSLSQKKRGDDSKVKSSGKRGKKGKVETESQNIKEMFTRASRREG
ncbi:ribonuclease H2 subunit B isoform X2 [Tripterygium wilfordii]|uniref:ribonuclease H2 subunit B isoform X2 n=1 Tax=Tripterygium wilfordii TaxID=458696 RepID=UPI0018F806A5|nr:ribonuclease H2 subunit B isoform X2 [Tripterygium wilfordii]